MRVMLLKGMVWLCHIIRVSGSAIYIRWCIFETPLTVTPQQEISKTLNSSIGKGKNLGHSDEEGFV